MHSYSKGVNFGLTFKDGSGINLKAFYPVVMKINIRLSLTPVSLFFAHIDTLVQKT